MGTATDQLEEALQVSQLAAPVFSSIKGVSPHGAGITRPSLVFGFIHSQNLPQWVPLSPFKLSPFMVSLISQK